MRTEIEKLMQEYQSSCIEKRPENIQWLSDGYVFDENQSVKWNRQMVYENNIKYNKAVHELENQRISEMYQAQLEVEKYIMQAAKTGQKGARAIFNFAQKEAYWDYDEERGCSAVEWIEKLCELFSQSKED